MQQIELELAGGGVLTVSLRASLDAMPAVKQRPLVLVVPGGGYNHVSPREYIRCNRWKVPSRGNS